MSQCTFWCSVLSDLDGLSEGQRATIGLNAPSGAQCFPTYKRSLKKYPHGQSQCTFWCSVLSDALTTSRSITTACRSQCTFWCSVLSDALRTDTVSRSPDRLSLNAPSGAQCFPTPNNKRERRAQTSVSMHLLVLSAFRPFSSLYGLSLTGLNAPSGAQCFPTIKLLNFSSTNGLRLNAPSGAQCFPTRFLRRRTCRAFRSQCTFWCSVLSDPMVRGCGRRGPVCLNAPSGAQCFPTRRQMEDHGYGACSVSMHLLVLSAFRLEGEFDCAYADLNVSMHLLVLSAFRPFERLVADYLRDQSQCTFWCSVLSDLKQEVLRGLGVRLSQCTFWCSVLSDSAPRKPRHNAVYRNEIAADLESTTSNRLAPVQLNHTTAKNRHKTTQRRRCPLPASTPPASNEPKPKNRRLTITPKLTSSYWASRIPCCKVMTILPAEKPIQVYTEIKITRKHQIENQQHRIGDWVLLCVNDAETHTRLIKG